MNRQPAPPRIGMSHLVVPLTGLVGTESSLIGPRANRLARACRHGLNVPSGVVLPIRALGSILDADDTTSTASTTRALDEIFETLGCGGAVPLAVSVSPLHDHHVVFTPTPDTAGLVTRAALFHTARRLSATASMADEPIALVVQRDVRPVQVGTLPITRSRHAHRSQVIGGLPITRRARRRLSSLRDRTNVSFAADVTIMYGVDAADHVWLLDVRLADDGDAAPSNR